MTKSFGFREVIFSVNCFIAAMLVALDRVPPGPARIRGGRWSRSISPASRCPARMRARAVYRVVGTLIGAIVMVVIVPNLVDAPELTTAAIILWVAFCLYVSLLDRTPRAYAFALSGYTAALVGLSQRSQSRRGLRHGDCPHGRDHARHGMRRAGAQRHFSAQCLVGLAGETERRAGRCAALDRRRIDARNSHQRSTRSSAGSRPT